MYRLLKVDAQQWIFQSHAVRIAHGFHCLVHLRIADVIRLGRLKVIAHSCNKGVGLLKNAMQILEFNVAGGSIIINCRESFCCVAKNLLGMGDNQDTLHPLRCHRQRCQ